MFFNFNFNNMFPENFFCTLKEMKVGSHEFSWNSICKEAIQQSASKASQLIMQSISFPIVSQL